MERFPIGVLFLLVISLVVYLGLAHRALDRMRLSDQGALVAIGAIILGSFINIPVPFAPFNTSINVGGAIVPVGLAIYLLAKAGTRVEWFRALVATAATAAFVYVIGSLVNAGTTVEPAGRYAVIDAIYLYPIAGGIVAYLFGRSRRAAFIAATLGVLAVHVIHYVWLLVNGAPANYVVNIGGAGAFDTIVIAGIVAVLLAEAIGETRERLAGGPGAKGRPPELVKALKKPEIRESGWLGRRDTEGNSGENKGEGEVRHEKK